MFQFTNSNEDVRFDSEAHGTFRLDAQQVVTYARFLERYYGDVNASHVALARLVDSCVGFDNEYGTHDSVPFLLCVAVYCGIELASMTDYFATFEENI